MNGFTVILSLEQRICNGYGADGVISETALVCEQLKIVVIGSVELESATYDISYDCS